MDLSKNKYRSELDKMDGRFSVSPIDGNGAVQSGGDKINGVALETSIINRPLRSSKNEDSVECGGIGETWLHDAGWRRKKSLAQLTREALPRLDNYRNSKRAIKRPSLGELHGELIEEEASGLERDTKSPTPGSVHEGIKLGWIQGVLIPCLLNIWGVMLFLRISWVVAQAGIGMSLVIIAISAAVCVITTLSLSAISTNGEVKGGGIYYIISRSLGAEFGASVGVVFAFANAVAASMNTIGFCDSLNDLLKSEGWSQNGVDVRIVGAVALLVMCIICAVGMEWETKAQNFLIAIIVGAIVDFMVGTIIGPTTDQQVAEGFVGFNSTVMADNWLPDYRYSEGRSQDFFSVFAIFFPSVTGIQAGANISGDLKDPASSIPRGTLLALLISMVSYAIMVLFAGGAALRDAPGLNGTLNELINATNATQPPYGLHNSYTVMQLMSSWGPFIFAGCFAATLSTALTNLLSVPRLIQALGQDRIYPGLIFFSKGYGKNGEPYRGYVITFLVSLLFLLIADLNTIAPLISNFYLASYALINFCTFHAAFIKPLGWRPTFRFYNAWLSLAGFVICVAIMFLISWVMSLVTFVIIFALYLIVMYRNPDVNWGSSTQAQTYMNALSSAHRLCNTGEHVKNYRPQLLVLCGAAAARPALLDMGHALTKGGSLMIAANITSAKLSYRGRQARNREATAWLGARKLKAFVASVDGLGFEMGARALVQASGIGKLAPNVLLMGYKGDWRSCPRHDLNSYFDILHTAFENRLAVSILRVSGGLDYSRVTGINGVGGEEAPNGALTLTAASSSCELSLARNVTRMLHYDSDLDIAKHHGDTNHSTGNTTPTKAATITEGMKPDKKDKKTKKDKKVLSRQIIYQANNGLELSKEMMNSMSIFQRKQPKGTLDVWWLYDDGGLTILLPYILSTRSQWSDCKLRIFALANRKYEMELEERNMANLLSKFRIDYSSLTMVQDITEPPQTASIEMFNGLIEGFREQDGAPNDCCITDIELQTLQEKTYRQLRLRELLIQNSTGANLIIMSLPMPRKGSVPAPLYMAWLEMMSRDLPPVLFVRGNQTSVLTFYS